MWREPHPMDRQAVGRPQRGHPTPGSLGMSIPLRAGTILKQHVTLEVEGIDRLYLNAYVPGLQTEGAVADFFRRHRGELFASSALMLPITKAFLGAIEQFIAVQKLP